MNIGLSNIEGSLRLIVGYLGDIGTTLRAAFPIPLTSSAVYDPPSIAAGESATTTVAVTGAVLGKSASASFSISLGGLVLTAYVSAANVVTCVFSNVTAAPIDIGSGTINVKVFNQ